MSDQEDKNDNPEDMDVQEAALMVVNAIQDVQLLLLDNDVSSSSEEEQEEIELIAHAAQALVSRDDYLEDMFPRYSAEQFENYFHMTVEAYETLERKIGPLLKSADSGYGRPQIPIKKQILPSLWLLHVNGTYSSAQELFDMSKSSLSRNFERIVVALNQIAPQVIKWPSSEERASLKKKFNVMGGLPNVIGAIDGIFIPIKGPKTDKDTFITNKGGYAFTAQAICNSDFKFTDIFIGYPGSVNDTKIFKNSPIYEDIIEKKREFFDEGEIIIGDEAYPLLDWCISPYNDKGKLTPGQEYFNVTHALQATFIRRSLAALFGRFQRLKYLDMNRNDLIPATVLACCVLHNICMDHPKNKFEHYEKEGIDSLLFPDIDEDEEVEQEEAGVQYRNELCQKIFVIKNEISWA